MFKLFLICFISFQFAGLNGYTQFTKTDSSHFQQQAVENAIRHYRLFEGDQSRLYNGTIYRGTSAILSNGHPYFETNEFKEGLIHYDGVAYQIPFIYNIVTDEIIINHFNNLHKIRLINSKVKNFTIGAHHFIHVADINNEILKTGFYEQLFNGKVQVLKKSFKRISETIVNQQIVASIQYGRNYYIQKDSTWYRISNLRSLLDVFPEQKNHIRQLLKANKINFRKNPDAALMKIAANYEGVTR